MRKWRTIWQEKGFCPTERRKLRSRLQSKFLILLERVFRQSHNTGKTETDVPLLANIGFFMPMRFSGCFQTSNAWATSAHPTRFQAAFRNQIHNSKCLPHLAVKGQPENSARQHPLRHMAKKAA